MGTSYKSEVRVGERVYVLEIDRLDSSGYSIYGLFTTRSAAIAIGEQFEAEELIHCFKVTQYFLNA